MSNWAKPVKMWISHTIIMEETINNPINKKVNNGITTNPDIIEKNGILLNNDACIINVTINAEIETDSDPLIFSGHHFSIMSLKISAYNKIPPVARYDNTNPISNIQYGLTSIINRPEYEIGVNLPVLFPEKKYSDWIKYIRNARIEDALSFNNKIYKNKIKEAQIRETSLGKKRENIEKKSMPIKPIWKPLIANKWIIPVFL